MYNEGIRNSEEAFFQGKQEAYEEMLKWFMGFNNSDFKHVSVNDFFNYLSQKMKELKFEILKRNVNKSTQSAQKINVGLRN